MKRSVVRKQVRRLAGKRVYAVTKRGVVVGKLLRVSSRAAWIRPEAVGGKPVNTRAVLPLVLYDLLAVGTAPYGGFPGPVYPGYGAYPPVGPFYPGYGGYGPPYSAFKPPYGPLR